MRMLVAALGLALAIACDRPNDVGPANSPAPAAVTCADAPQLRQRALDERRLSVGTTSDQEKIVAGSRATFYMSLAIIADLKCKVTSAEADATLTRALAAARKTEGTRSFYERAVLWTEAGVTASEAISMFLQQLSTSQ